MLAAVDWSGVPIAGAFVLGVVAGGVGAIRVMRYALEHLKPEQDPRPPS